MTTRTASANARRHGRRTRRWAVAATVSVAAALCWVAPASATSTDLQAAVDATPSGGTLTLDHDYLDLTATLTVTHPITINGAGHTLKWVTDGTELATSNLRRTRSHLRIQGTSDVSVSNLNIVGANVNGGTSDIAYNSLLEAQHGVEVLYSQRVSLESVTVSYVFGDCLYVGGYGTPSVGVTAHSFTGHHNGRQGIAITNAQDVTLTNLNLHDIRRSAFDLEPNRTTDIVHGFTVDGATIGAFRLGFLSVMSAGGSVSDVTLRNVTSWTVFGNVSAPLPANGTRPARFVFDHVVSLNGQGSKQQALLSLSGVDGFALSNSTLYAQTGRGMNLMEALDSTNVVVTNNILRNVVGMLKPTSTSTIIESGNTMI